MVRPKLRPLLLGLGTAAVMLGTTPAAATAAEAPAPKGASDAAYYSCTVPRGYTYNHVSRTTTCSTGVLYHVVKPKTGLWACTVPAGFTWTQTSTTIVCTTSGFGTLYLLRAK
ncbi:hypothetical protein [Streptomyces sp. NPDC052496]|uniref:hypothetical protein n=1 Tax=Streptomyces sp. NPDC052496 TaxID=3154951 RepID=UPI0034133D48